MSIIQVLTKDCKRKDCSISFGATTTTLMAWTPTYDKYGNRSSKDPNIYSREVRCSLCGTRWYIREQEGKEPKITTLM